MRPDPDHLQQCISKIYLSVLICLKLAIYALNSSIGMVGAGVNFFNFSASMGLPLDRLKVFQILKLVGSYFGTFRCADLKAT